MMQDDTAAIYVSTTNRNCKLKPGQLVEIAGVTSSGDFAPMVIASNIRVLGEGSLPVPRERTFEQIATGAEDGQWVRVSGIVRSAIIDRLTNYTRLSLELATGGHRLTVRVPNVDSINPADLIDCDVTVTGICFPVFNRKRQLLTVRLRAPSLEQITFKRPACPASFGAPGRSINSLMQFEPQMPHGHRVKVRGVVTLQKRGEFLFIQDQTQGLWIKTSQATGLSSGDVVDVLGFPAFGEYNPVLEDAIFAKAGTASPPQPAAISVEQGRSGDFDAELVQLDATVLNAAQTGEESIFVLQERDSIFRAHLQLRNSTSVSSVVRPGSRVRLTGVCLTQAGTDRAPQSFRILLRAPADIQVLSAPSWWTLPRVAMALGIMAVIVFAAMIWVLTLRRRVRAQTAEIQRKIEREAVLEERTRIAREFHDTIEQQLAAVTLQVHAARTRLTQAPDSATHLLQLAEGMLRHTKSEARSSVWDLRARALEEGGLDAALRAIVDYVRNGSPVEIEVSVMGDRYPVPSAIENHLLRIAQEATANAVKHSDANNVRLALSYGPETIQLVVEDDGNGFDIESTGNALSGHFGLLGMRERAEKIGGGLDVVSAPGAGTKVVVTVPMAGMRTGKERAVLT